MLAKFIVYLSKKEVLYPFSDKYGKLKNRCDHTFRFSELMVIYSWRKGSEQLIQNVHERELLVNSNKQIYTNHVSLFYSCISTIFTNRLSG